MKRIATVTINGNEIEGIVTETIIRDNEFFNFEVIEKNSSERITLRIETEENYNDRKARGC